MAFTEYTFPATMTDKDQALALDLLNEAKTKAGEGATPMQVWAVLHQNLLKPSMTLEVHQWCYQQVYSSDAVVSQHDIKPSWIPTPESIRKTNIGKLMKEKGFTTYEELYDWSTKNMEAREEFWMESIDKLDILWEKKPTNAFDMTSHDEQDGGPAAHAKYFPGGRLNIVDSCFHKRNSNSSALVYAIESDPRTIQTMSFGVLERLSNRIANSILQNKQSLQLQPGDAIAICMPMTPESIAIYLGIIKAGCVVVSIADSFSAKEIATRCRLGHARAIFTQDVIHRGNKFLPLYHRVLEADDILVQETKLQHGRGTMSDESDEGKESKTDDDAGITHATEERLKVVVLPGMLHAGPYHHKKKDGGGGLDFNDSGTWDDKDDSGNPVPLHESVVASLRDGIDFTWHDLMSNASDHFVSVQRDSMDACNILFSSGTTGEPKAIVWTHSTPIKCATDGYFHQDVQVGDRVAWPTNIGWMMGPWLVFQLINGATIGIFNGVTSTDAFCQFIEEAKISMLGIIPSLVKAWQARNATKDCDWSCVRRFSSTGEASDPDNYFWLQSRVPHYAPVIEYCGGTEIGGSYLSSTLVQHNVPSMFSTPVLGSQLYLLDCEGKVLANSNYKKKSSSTNCASISGEVALVPPSIGYSTHLLNRNHFDTYYKGMQPGPNGEVLRRHGDEIEMVCNARHDLPYYRALGRCDDTMNIGGIKVSSVEIERVCNLTAKVKETAAIGVSSGPHGGPCKLIVYAVLEHDEASSSNPAEEVDAKMLSSSSLRTSMQKMIKTKLNPLFGIADVVITVSLPRTASNKVMRRLLRDEYVQRESAMAANRMNEDHQPTN